jgi:hypothetical protein
VRLPCKPLADLLHEARFRAVVAELVDAQR